jgi:A/G-specific adenine glycosylase
MPENRFVEISTHAIDAQAFRKELISWGRKHFRPFPWRLTEDPYLILMAEVMLHRTQARQVLPSYVRFVGKYPNIQALAQTSDKDLHEALFSLGLRWRIDLIHEMAAMLLDNFGGEVPQERVDLLSLPGVSDYVAGAVRCFAWNLPEPLIDTNTVRVVGRLFGLEVKDSSRRNRRFRDLIGALVDPEEPRAYNYALLDLASQVCKKRPAPECFRCPVQMHCVYGTRALTAPESGKGTSG